MHPTVRLAIQVGGFIWKKYESGGSFDRDGSIAKMIDEGSDQGVALHVCVQAEWYGNGMPRVVVGHKHAASLMSTSMRPEDVPDLRSPWSVFLLDVPSGMVRDANGNPVAAVLCIDIFDGERRSVTGVVMPESDQHATSWLYPAESVAELASAQARFHPSEQVLARYVVGAVAELTRHRGSIAAAGNSVARNSRGEPVTRTFQITRPVNVDCRPAVQSFLSGATRSSPSVQVLVRGHWKKQRHGEGFSQWRWQHIEPYWRGPEDGPIAVRPHSILRDPPTGGAPGEP